MADEIPATGAEAVPTASTAAIPTDTPAAATATTAPPQTEHRAESAEMLDASAIDELLKGATFDDAATTAAGASAFDHGDDASEFKLPDFQQVMQDAQVSSVDLLRDVDLNV